VSRPEDVTDVKGTSNWTNV